jgi:ribokinase
VRRERFAVVGHVEWVDFARVERVPRAGEVVHAREPFAEPAGGGAVAAVQLARLAGACKLVTALGDDPRGEGARRRLAELGVEVDAAHASEPTRWAVTLVDDRGERTITTFGPRLEPRRVALAGVERALDGVYFTAGGVEALRAAREGARVLVASPRARDALGHGIPLDALILSAEDPIERDAAAPVLEEADVVILTEGARGGSFTTRAGDHGRWEATPLPGQTVDSYGCGDSFAAGVTFGLGIGLSLGAALRLGALCGAACITGRGPYGRQLVREELPPSTWQDATRTADPSRGGS